MKPIKPSVRDIKGESLILFPISVTITYFKCKRCGCRNSGPLLGHSMCCAFQLFKTFPAKPLAQLDTSISYLHNSVQTISEAGSICCLPHDGALFQYRTGRAAYSQYHDFSDTRVVLHSLKLRNLLNVW